MLFSTLPNIDMFPNKIQFNMKSSDKYQTSTGAILTLILIVIISIQSISELRDILAHKDPQVTYERVYNEVPWPIELNSSNFVFAIKILDPTFNASSSFISLNLASKKFTRDPNGSLIETSTPISMKPCELSYMKGFESEYKTHRMAEAFCPDAEVYNIQGTLLNREFDLLELNVTSCQNRTDSPITCMPKDQISQHLHSGKSLQVQLIFSNTFVRPCNYSTPVKRFIDETCWFTSPNQSTMSSELFIGSQLVVSDDSLWVSKTNFLESYHIDATEQRNNLRPVDRIDSENFVIAHLQIKRSHYTFKTSRNYAKITTGLSNIGGIWSFLFGIFGLSLAFYTNKAYLVHLANEIYDFDFPDSPEKKNWKPKKVEGKENEDDTSSNQGTAGQKSSNLKEKVQRFSEKFSGMNKKKLRYNFLDCLLGTLSCMRRRKDKIINKVIDKVSEDIDILNLLRRVQDAENLKNVLLTKEQQDVFSYCQRPLIVVSNLDNTIEQKNQECSGETTTTAKKFICGSFKRENKEQFKFFYRFMRLSKGFQKLESDKDQAVNLKILELLNPELQKVLCDLNMVIKEDPQSCSEFEELVKDTDPESVLISTFTMATEATLKDRQILKANSASGGDDGGPDVGSLEKKKSKGRARESKQNELEKKKSKGRTGEAEMEADPKPNHVKILENWRARSNVRTETQVFTDVAEGYQLQNAKPGGDTALNIE